MHMITQDLLHELFYYKEGTFYNRFTRSPTAVKDAPCAALSKKGYRRIGINGKYYQASRLIWIYHNGEFPASLQIDHINRNRADDRIENLRLVTQTQNEWNKPHKGCSFEKGKWRARIKDHGKQVHLGLFNTEQEAQAAYKAYATKLHGDYQCA